MNGHQPSWGWEAVAEEIGKKKKKRKKTAKETQERKEKNSFKVGQTLT